ncbi:MAG: hypothetical protein ACOX50_01550 [Patescibacteria group bacterium]
MENLVNAIANLLNPIPQRHLTHEAALDAETIDFLKGKLPTESKVMILPSQEPKEDQ